MSRESYRHEHEDIRDLLRKYNNVRAGRSAHMLTEDSFERIIDHYDDLDDLEAAIEAAETGIEQHPYSAALIIKKADLLISTKRSTFKFCDWNFQLFFDSFTSRACCIEVILGEFLLVSSHPFNHGRFKVIVGDEGKVFHSQSFGLAAHVGRKVFYMK